MSPEFESRRQRRLNEAQQGPSAFVESALLQLSPDSQIAPAEREQRTPPAASQPISRRELRLREAVHLGAALGSSTLIEQPALARPATGYEPVSPAPSQSDAQPPRAMPSRREMREELRAVPVPLELPITPFAQPWSEPANQPMFQTSSGFSIDTVTNSIVLPITPDALNAPLISESGVTLKTGSIELPNLNAGTGSITIPAAAQIADEALSIEASTSFVSDISPIAAKNLLLRNRNLELTTVKTRGPKGQMFYALTASMLMLTVGGLLVVAWMYGVIK